MGRAVHTISHRARAARVELQLPLVGIHVPGRRTRRRDERALAGWLAPSQPAQLMGVHVNQLWTWRRAGLLPNTHYPSRPQPLRPHRPATHLRLRAGRKILPTNTAANLGDAATGCRPVAAVPRKLIDRRRRVDPAGTIEASGSDQNRGAREGSASTGAGP